MQYVIKQGESIYDVALKLYGDASFAVTLLNDNPLLDNVSNESIANIDVYYNELLKVSTKAPLIVSNAILSDTKPMYIVKNRQSIYDLSLTYGYGIEGVVGFLSDNPQLNNLNDFNINNKTILVTKKQNNISSALILQNKVLETGIIDGAGLSVGLLTADPDQLQTADGIDIFIA